MTDARELMIRLDRSANASLSRQLEDALRDAVMGGRLRPGTRLPATRTLAADLGVSRGVVVEAYEQLVAQGYLVGHGAGGTTVSDARHAHVSDGDIPQSRRHSRWPLLRRETAPGVLDVRPGAPDLANFPRLQWGAALTVALREASNAELGYSAPWGVPLLRERLADYLGRVRGATASGDTIVVTSGATQALTLLTRTLLRRGHVSLAVEDPSNAVQRNVLSSHGIRVLDVPVDDEGIDVAALERTDTRCVLLTPAHQFPTGVLMSPARREAVLRWAQAVDAVVIEDDYDGEFRYDDRSTMCLQGDDPMRVALVGSISKTLAPGLRLGWILPPMGLVGAVAETKRDDDFGSDVLTQLAFAHLLHSGRYDKHLRSTRTLYRDRRSELVAELTRRLPDWRITGLAAGQHLSVELPTTLDEHALVEQARNRGLLVLGMADLRGQPGPPALVLGFARLGSSSARRVVEILADAALQSGRRARPFSPTTQSGGWAPRGPAWSMNAQDYFPRGTAD